MVEGERLDSVPEWVPLSEATRITRVSDKTLRRRIAAGSIEARMEGNKYLVRTASLMPEPAEGRELIPMALLDRLDTLRAELQTEAVARARAEEIAGFQAERATLEIERRREIEGERDRLAAEVEALRARKWWQRKT